MLAFQTVLRLLMLFLLLLSILAKRSMANLLHLPIDDALTNASLDRIARSPLKRNLP